MRILRIAVRGGAEHLERMELELRRLEQDHRVTEPAYEALQHEFEVMGGYTLDQRVDETLSGLGFARGVTRPPVRVGGRTALARLVIADPDLPRRAPRTTSTSTPWSGRRSTSGAARARSSSRLTTGRSWMPP